MIKKSKNNYSNINLTKFAFTLVELLAVIIILGVLSLITFPIVDKSIKNSKEQSLKTTIKSVEEAAYNYSIENDLGYNSNYNKLDIETLINAGLLKEDIVNPVTNQELKGCVLYKWDSNYNQYEFEYSETCETLETEPIINITYDSSLINSNGWAKENVPVTIYGNGEIKYCISNTLCEPNEVISTGNNTKFIINEGANNVCAISSNSLGTTEKNV